MECNTWRMIINKTPVKELGPCFSHMSRSWETCAVGHKIGFDKTFRKKVNVEWRDVLTEKAYDLGSKFHLAIMQGDKKDALKVLDKIQKLDEDLIIKDESLFRRETG